MRVDDIAHRLRRNGRNGGFDLADHLRKHVVDEDDAVVAERDHNVAAHGAAHALEHIDAVAEIGGSVTALSKSGTGVGGRQGGCWACATAGTATSTAMSIAAMAIPNLV